jgi:hypothetical protein
MRLYDLARDPAEAHDLADAPDHQDRRRDLERRLLRLQQAMDDPMVR